MSNQLHPIDLMTDSEVEALGVAINRAIEKILPPQTAFFCFFATPGDSECDFHSCSNIKNPVWMLRDLADLIERDQQ